MREIKFRAWDKTKIIMSDEWPNLSGFFGTRSSDEIIMQYTGLKDKQGKEIYEGDIVLVPNWRFTPENGENPNLIERCPDITNFHWYEELNEMIEDKEIVEIIGNIYENPDLINQV